MRVNSSFKRFLAHRSAAGPGIGMVMLAIVFVGSSFTRDYDRDVRAKHVNLTIRQIGHRLLLQAGDSTSRVLPVTETKEGTFLLQFENEFVFSHDSLMAMSRNLLPKTQFPSGYTVTVHDCLTAGIVYGFQFNNTSPDLLPCRGRRQPPGCYTIEFAFPDFYKSIEPEEADADQLTEEQKSVKAALREVNPKPEDIKQTTLDYHIDRMSEERESLKVAPQETTPKSEEIKLTTFDYSMIGLVYSGMLVLLGVALLIGRFGKIFTPVSVLMQDQNHATIKESVPELVVLGKFLFDVKGQRLLLENEVIGLTDKECKILELLNRNFGDLIARETLMQEIWINEGVITGRSLDVFVSKLRKKLSSDPELRITNVHGKGYKLEIPVL